VLPAYVRAALFKQRAVGKSLGQCIVVSSIDSAGYWAPLRSLHPASPLHTWSQCSTSKCVMRSQQHGVRASPCESLIAQCYTYPSHPRVGLGNHNQKKAPMESHKTSKLPTHYRQRTHLHNPQPGKIKPRHRPRTPGMRQPVLQTITKEYGNTWLHSSAHSYTPLLNVWLTYPSPLQALPDL